MFGCFFAFMLLLPSGSKCQVNDSTKAELNTIYGELDQLFAEEDSVLAMFRMVDSLLLLEEQKYHSIMSRVGYISTVSSAGRSEDVQQRGYSVGASYFHPSGLFADASGFWNQAYSPSYYLTGLSIGYMNTFWKKWNFTANHDFYFYNDTLSEANAFNKSLQIGNYLELKWLDIGVDYGFLYGNENAHRLVANANLQFSWRTNFFISRISIMPGASIQWGNANIVYLRQSDSPILDILNIVQQEDYPELERREYLRFSYLLAQQRQSAAILYLRRRGFSNEQIEEIITTYQEQQVQQSNVFGLMNYSFSFPLSLQLGKFNLLLNYTYNIPIGLPGEVNTYEPNGFLSATLSHAIVWK
jgi:hypothetical protein